MLKLQRESVNTCLNVQNTKISKDAWTKAVQLKSSAHQTLSDLSSATSRIQSALSKPNMPSETKETLLRKLQSAKRATEQMALEKRLVQLTEKQLETFAAWLDTDISEVAALGSNRSGKTFGLAAAIAYDIRELAPAGSIFLCVAKDSAQSARTQQKEIWNLLPKEKFDTAWSGEKNGFGSKNPTVVYDRGGRNITLLFMTDTQFEDNPYSFEAITAYRAWADEAVQRECYAAIGVRIATSESSKIALSSIRNMSWIEDLMDDAEADETIHIQEYYPEDNPVMHAENVKRMTKFARRGGEDIAAMRIDGKALEAGARVYVEFEKARHVITKREFLERVGDKDGKLDVAWYAGMDEGMDHPTVWLLCAVDKDRNIFVYDEYSSRNTTPEVDVPQIKALLGDRVLRMPTVADNAMWQNKKTGMTAMRYKEAGLPLMPSPNKQLFSEDRGVQMIKDMFLGDELFVCENCKLLISNLLKWKYKRKKHTQEMLEMDKYENRNNDALDALRYLIQYKPKYARRKAGVVDEY